MKATVSASRSGQGQPVCQRQEQIPLVEQEVQAGI